MSFSVTNELCSWLTFFAMLLLSWKYRWQGKVYVQFSYNLKDWTKSLPLSCNYIKSCLDFLTHFIEIETIFHTI